MKIVPYAKVSLISFFLIFLIINSPLLSAGNDIEASITAQWGNGSPRIVIFGQNVSVGNIATATLREDQEKTALAGFEDPLPTYSQCSGYGYFRDANMSIISRITIGQGRVLILIRHAGGRGQTPGSQGYVNLNNGWKIIDLLSTGTTNEYSDCYVKVLNDGTKLIWSSRAGCPACACLEGRTYIAFVVGKSL